MRRSLLFIWSFWSFLLAEPSFAGSKAFSLFVDQAYSGLQTINLNNLLKQQNPSLDLSVLDLVSIEAFASGKGQILVAVDANNGTAILVDQENFLDIYTLPVPAPRGKGSTWTLWLAGEIYIESIDLVLRDRQPPPLPDKVSCPGAWGQVDFVISQPFSTNPKVEVIAYKDFVWVMAGLGDRKSGPWLAGYPNRSNFKGGAKHWKAERKNHWQFQVPRTYSSSGFGNARVYFMVDAVKDNPYAGTIVDWCDLSI